MVLSVASGFAGAAFACGLLLSALAISHESGLAISLWLGLIAALAVAVGLGVLYLALSVIPGGLVSAQTVSRNVIHRVLVATVVSITISFFATALTRPDRISDWSAYVLIGFAYGIAAGFGYWAGARFAGPA